MDFVDYLKDKENRVLSNQRKQVSSENQREEKRDIIIFN